MQLQLTVRLPKELHQEILSLANRLHLKRSDIVRIALEKFTKDNNFDNEIRPYERVKDLIGSVSTGISDLGSDHRKYLLERIKNRA
jgi:metal-responsive CopG/Arc/MetJ family transcriptional regulator